MEKGKNSTAAYICPECGGTVVSGVDILKLSGDMMKLKCSCGESELVTVRDGGRVVFTVPCFLCGKPHTFIFREGETLSSLYRGGCPFSGLDIFFFGEKDEVLAAAKQSSDEIRAVLEEEGVDIDAFGKGAKTPKDAHVRDMLMLVFTELLEDGKVFCGCTENGEDGEYSIRETDEAIVLECSRCKRKRAAYCDGSLDTQNLLEAYSITLT